MKPGASHAIDGPAYISPFQLKHESFSHARRAYVDDLYYEGKYDSDIYKSTRRAEERRDMDDHHYQWTLWRTKYANGDDAAMDWMLSYVTASNPPDKSPEMIASHLAKPRRGIFGRGARAG